VKNIEKLYVTVLRVEGSGDFPFDMLRYDSCCPAQEEDSVLLASHHQEKRIVTLRRFNRSGAPATATRWKSFGWTVFNEEPL
jgi:hypothetical protein